MLSITNLTVSARATGIPIVLDFNMTIASGEIVCLHGVSGAGKTTIAHAVAGLLPDDLAISSGRIEFAGQDLTQASEMQWRALRGKQIGMVFQDASAALNPLHTCGQQLDFALHIHGHLDAADRFRRSLDCLRSCGITDAERIYHSYPHEISGGQCQRVLFSITAILAPRLLIADEPSSALDDESATILATLFRAYAEKNHAAVLIITHDHTRLSALATRSIVLQKVQQPITVDAQRSDEKPSVAYRDSGASPPDSSSLLDVRGLHKRYYRVHNRAQEAPPVLADITLSLPAGRLVSIVGPSGAGKTTLGRCLAGLLSPDSGAVLIDGKPVGMRQRGKVYPVQLIYQNHYASLSPLHTVGQILGEALLASGQGKATLTISVQQLLTSVALPTAYTMRFPSELSGGERQRVAIARCLAACPRVIVADEPTSSLDPENAHVIWALLRQVANDSQIAVLVITHNAEMAALYCDDGFLLDNGTLLQLPTSKREGQVHGHAAYL